MEDLKESQESPERKQLRELEATSLYVFHGSGNRLEQIEPRQAIDAITGPDGKPAIFASPHADYGIFMAIVNKFNCPLGVRANSGTVEHDDGSYELKLGATKETLDQLQPYASGYVYVFNKKDFMPRPGRPVEYLSHQVVRPLQVVAVKKRDLPKDIEVVERLKPAV